MCFPVRRPLIETSGSGSIAKLESGFSFASVLHSFILMPAQRPMAAERQGTATNGCMPVAACNTRQVRQADWGGRIEPKCSIVPAHEDVL